MENIIILILLAVLAVFAVRGSIRHFRGEGGCCGGTSSKPKKKKLKNKITGTYTFDIEGMHCSNCADRITRSLNELDGVSAKVSHKRHSAKIFCDRQIDVEQLKQAVERGGYKVTETSYEKR